MKNRKLILLSAVALAGILAACTSKPNTPSSQSNPGESSASSAENSSTSEPSSIPVVTYTVTFDLNYAGSTPIKAEVVEGETVGEPTNITREGYGLTGWYTEAACENEYDFSTPVTADLTLYASWLEVNENTRTATFHWNIQGQEDVYTVVYFETGKRVSKPADPALEGHNFRGWYTEAACTTEWVALAKYNDNLDLYAKWFTIYTLEAEYTQMDGLPTEDILNGLANQFGEKVGHGYSSDTYGVHNIFPGRDLNASNDWYVSNMYYAGAYIEFDIEAAAAVTDAILVARLTCEYFDMTFRPGYYDFEVNGTALDYNPISLKCTKSSAPSGLINPKRAEAGSGAEVPFSNFTINTAVSLQQGKNVIKLVTHNSDRQDNTGTMGAMAPLVDCIYVHTNTALTFEAYTENVD